MRLLEELGLGLSILIFAFVGYWFLWPLKRFKQLDHLKVDGQRLYRWPYNTHGRRMWRYAPIRLMIWHHRVFVALRISPMESPEINIVELPGDTATILTQVRNYTDAVSLEFVAQGETLNVDCHDTRFSSVLTRNYNVGMCAHCCLAELAQELVPQLVRPVCTHWRRATTRLAIQRSDNGEFTHGKYRSWPVKIQKTWRNFFKRPCSDWR